MSLEHAAREDACVFEQVLMTKSYAFSSYPRLAVAPHTATASATTESLSSAL